MFSKSFSKKTSGAFLLAAVIAAATTQQASGQTRRALLVGIDRYAPEYGASPLYSCVNDVVGMRSIMLEADPLGRWNMSNVFMLTDASATKSAIRSALQALAAASGAGDLVLYAHSSHGGQYSGTSTYLCSYNADYTDVELGNDLALFNESASVVVVVDACHSGGLFKGGEWLFAERALAACRAARAEAFRRRGEPAPGRDLAANVAFMTACEYNEYSWSGEPYSLYIGYLLQGCLTPEVDADADGEYTFAELHGYAAVRALAENPNQHAQYYNLPLLQRTAVRGSPYASARAPVAGDFDGDGRCDPACYAAAQGRWNVGGANARSFQWGGTGLAPLAGDYDGDGACDAAVFNAQTGAWYIKSVVNSNVLCWDEAWGGAGFTPVAGDFDGDRVSDLAVYHEQTGTWYVKSLVRGRILFWGEAWGGAGFTPVAGDFDGDGVSDAAVYERQSGMWYVRGMAGGIIAWALHWGGPGCTPIAGRFSGGSAAWQPAVYHAASGLWYICDISGNPVSCVAWGGSALTAATGDFDGDERYDLAVFDPVACRWYVTSLDGRVILWAADCL